MWLFMGNTVIIRLHSNTFWLHACINYTCRGEENNDEFTINPTRICWLLKACENEMILCYSLTLFDLDEKDFHIFCHNWQFTNRLTREIPTGRKLRPALCNLWSPIFRNMIYFRARGAICSSRDVNGVPRSVRFLGILLGGRRDVHIITTVYIRNRELPLDRFGEHKLVWCGRYIC